VATTEQIGGSDTVLLPTWAQTPTPWSLCLGKSSVCWNNAGAGRTDHHYITNVRSCNAMASDRGPIWANNRGKLLQNHGRQQACEYESSFLHHQCLSKTEKTKPEHQVQIRNSLQPIRAGLITHIRFKCWPMRETDGVLGVHIIGLPKPSEIST